MRTVADGVLDSSGAAWRLDVSEPVTADEVRMIANQLHAVANAIETRRPDRKADPDNNH